MNAKEKLIVALDVDNFDRCRELIDILSPEVDVFKIGIAPFTAFGDALLNKLQEAGKKVFLDLKFHDIPNTVKNAACAAAKKDVYMMNFHCLGGGKMLEAAVEGAAEGSRAGVQAGPILLGVTILTSMNTEDMRALGLGGTVEEKVMELASLARDSGLHGVVASAEEARDIRERAGKDFLIVTPGVRPEWAQKGDQKRVVTPEQAILNGADHIVVGRPIIQAEDPAEAAKKIINEIGS